MTADRSAVASCLFLLAVLIISLVIPLAAQRDPLQVRLDARLAAPSSLHWFGTDDLGRDVLSRSLHGFATTVMVSVGALLSAMMIGVVVGAMAGYRYGSPLDRTFQWMANLVVSLPFLLVMASILSFTRPTVYKAYLVLACLMWVNPARLVRAEVIRTTNLEYVAAARALGSPEGRILFRTVLPACVATAVSVSLGYLPEIVGLEAGLSFLGLGVQPPEPGLGKMIFDGLSFIHSAWWMSVFPAALLFGLVLALNVFRAWIRRNA